MWITKVKIALLALVSVSLLGVGAGVATYGALADKPAAAGQAQGPKLPVQVAERPKPVEEQPPRTDRYGDPLPDAAIARLGTTRFRHGWLIQSVAFSPDGKLVASGGAGRGVCLWEAATGKELRLLVPGDQRHHGVVFSPDGKTLASAGESIRLWDVATGQELRRLEGHTDSVMCVAFSPDGLTLASASYDRTVRHWDVATGQPISKLEGHEKPVFTVVFSPDGKLLASAGEDKTVRLWDRATGKELNRLLGHHGEIRSLSFSPDGKLLASADHEEQVIRLWDVAARQEVRTLGNRTRQADPMISWVAFSPDGKLLAEANADDGTVGLWDVATSREVRRWQAHPFRTFSVAFSPDGKTIASGGEDSTVRLWETATAREIRPLGGHQGMMMRGFVAFLPGSNALVSHGRDNQVLRWDLATGEERVYFPGLDGPRRWQRAALSPDGRVLATGDVWPTKDDYPVRLWDAATGRELHTLGKHRHQILTLAFSADGKRLASGSFDETIGIWDVTAGKEMHRLQGHQRGVRVVAFAPDGNTLASAGDDNTLRLWDSATGKERRRWENVISGGTIAFSPDGKLLVASSGSDRKPVRLWEVATGKERHSLDGDEGSTFALAFSPDSRFLATGGVQEDDRIRLWELASGQEVRRFHGHHSGVFALAFMADGRRLASGGGDSVVMLWDVRGHLDGRRKQERLAPPALEADWAALAGEDAAKAYQSIWDLAAAPKLAVPFLHERLRPPSSKTDSRQIERWIAELDSARFAVRERAAQALEQLGEAAEPALRKALAGRPTLEARRRLEQLIDRQEKRSHLETLRWLRAMVILETIATPEAMQVLERLAQGGGKGQVSDEAKASLERLAKRSIASP